MAFPLTHVSAASGFWTKKHTPLIMTWDTRNLSAGSTADNTIQLPLATGSGYSFRVDWGDGTQNIVRSYNDPNATHVYATPGIYTVKIWGSVPRFYFNGTGDRLKILNITQWGNNRYKDMGSAFYGCGNLVVSATDIPDVSKVLSFSRAFQNATSFNTNVNSWNMSSATSLAYMFAGATAFNQPLNSWNTSKVTTMSNIFAGATSFNQPLDSWDVSKVTVMAYMFHGATSFNQPLNSWNTESATSMWSMFYGATNFNQPINLWNTANVINMSTMFFQAYAFNQPLNLWNTSSVTNMNSMFNQASAFNQNLSGWTVNPNVTACSGFKTSSPMTLIPSFSSCTP